MFKDVGQNNKETTNSDFITPDTNARMGRGISAFMNAQVAANHRISQERNEMEIDLYTMDAKDELKELNLQADFTFAQVIGHDIPTGRDIKERKGSNGLTSQYGPVPLGLYILLKSIHDQFGGPTTTYEETVTDDGSFLTHTPFEHVMHGTSQATSGPNNLVM